MASYFSVKQREFIRDLKEWNIEKLHKKYSLSYRQVVKYRAFTKKKVFDK